jgi:hypothetical protein
LAVVEAHDLRAGQIVDRPVLAVPQRPEVIDELWKRETAIGVISDGFVHMRIEAINP